MIHSYKWCSSTKVILYSVYSIEHLIYIFHSHQLVYYYPHYLLDKYQQIIIIGNIKCYIIQNCQLFIKYTYPTSHICIQCVYLVDIEQQKHQMCQCDCHNSTCTSGLQHNKSTIIIYSSDILVLAKDLVLAFI